MGAAPYCKVGQVGHDFIFNESTLHPVPIKCGKTFIVADNAGIVCFDLELVSRIGAYCKKRTAMDQVCMVDLKSGKTIVDTFAKHRGK